MNGQGGFSEIFDLRADRAAASDDHLDFNFLDFFSPFVDADANDLGRFILLDLDAVGGPDFNETRHFVTCIREDRTPWSNLEDLVKTMKFCEVIVEGVKGTV